ncbi:MAG: secretion protein HlyD, partial [Sphingomonas hengshuiensis]
DRMRAQIAGAATELASLESQIADQRRLVGTAESQFADVQRIAASGFISRRDIQEREAVLITRRQQLAQLEQLRAAKRADQAEAQRAIAQSVASAQAQVASIQSSRAGILQRIAETELSRGYAVTAPVDGVVTALTARIGQAVSQQQPLLLIVPAHAQRRAELYVPTSAAGFLAPGQPVRLAIDAFPYQRFGTVSARIREISTAAITRQGPSGPVPVYLVTADLADASVKAFGRKQPLLPGMTLSARIITEKRSLLEWLFEPLFAVRNR